MLSILFSLLSLSALSAPLATQDLPVMTNVRSHGPGCPDNAVFSDVSSSGATLSFPSFNVEIAGSWACLKCSITFDLAGTASNEFHGIVLDVLGETSLDNGGQSIVFLAPVGQTSSRKLYTESTGGEAKGINLQTVINEKTAQINVYACAIGGGKLGLDKIKIEFAQY
jgi:hypothetical protein